MRASEIRQWLVHVLRDGATELVDAEVAKHIVRVYELLEGAHQRFGRAHQECLRELLGYDHTPHEMAVTMSLLRARAAQLADAASPAQHPAGAVARLRRRA
jgi:hypothetical protein